MRLLIIAGLLALLTSTAQAQSSSLSGTVSRDTIGTRVAKVEVQLPQLSRTTQTNANGDFQFGSVPPGHYTIVARALGFESFVGSFEIAPSQQMDVDIVLTPTVVTLEAQHTTASVVEKRLPPGIQEMEERRQRHLGGFFVTDSMLRANNERKLTYFFAQIPHVEQALATMGTGIYLVNGRNPLKRDRCYIDVYMDGARYFIGPASETNPPPDFSVLNAFDFSGIEYYPGAASIPQQYNATKGMDCGVILLWTRRTP